MVQFFNDSFTEAGSVEVELQNHISDSGNAWTADANIVIDANGDFVKSSQVDATRLFPHTDASPGTPDYSVSMDVTVLDTANFTITGPMARVQGVSTNSGYAYCIDPNEQTATLYRYDNGSEVQIGTPFSIDLSTLPVTYNLKVEPSGSTIKGYVDNVERDSIVDTTYTSAGVPGFIIRVDTLYGHFQIDNMSADTLGSTQTVSTSDTGRPGQQITISTSGFTSGFDAASWSDGTNSIILAIINQTTVQFPSLTDETDYAVFGSGTLTVTNNGNGETANTNMPFSQTTGWDLVTLEAGFGTTPEYITNYFGNPAVGQQIHYNPSQNGETLTVNPDGGATSTGSLTADLWVTDPSDGRLQFFQVTFDEEGVIVSVSFGRKINIRKLNTRSINVRGII